MVGTDTSAAEEIRRYPGLLARLSLSAMEEAEHLREGYVAGALHAADQLRDQLRDTGLFDEIHQLPDGAGPRLTACFVDGGVGQVEMLGTHPVLVRAALFRIAEGERDLARRETFAFFPVILGDLTSGEKRLPTYVTTVRAIAELGALLRSFHDHRFADVELLMLHGPLLLPLLGPIGPHWFSRADLVRMLNDDAWAAEVVEDLYSAIPVTFHHKGGLRAVAVISELVKRSVAASRNAGSILCGVVERERSTEVVHVYRKRLPVDVRTFDLPDELFTGLVLREGEYLEPFRPLVRYKPFKSKKLSGFEKTLPGVLVTWLKTGPHGLPVRVEFPDSLTSEEIVTMLRKVREYSSLLPNYAFPLGLDVADKMAKVPKWMSSAYRDAIGHELSVLLAQQSADPAELVRLLCFTSTNRSVMARPGVA